jgi:hypothetical protein
MRTLAAILALAASLFFGGASANPLDQGPMTLTLQYHTAPGDRMALKDYMHVTGLKQFAGWRDQGIIKDYRIYWSRYTDSLNWDMLAVVQFATPEKMAEWRKIEARFPAGLPISVAKLTTAIHTNPADLHFAKGEQSPNGVYLIIPTTTSSPRTSTSSTWAHTSPRSTTAGSRRKCSRATRSTSGASGVALLVGADDPRIQGRGLVGHPRADHGEGPPQAGRGSSLEKHPRQQAKCKGSLVNMSWRTF